MANWTDLPTLRPAEADAKHTLGISALVARGEHEVLKQLYLRAVGHGDCPKFAELAQWVNRNGTTYATADALLRYLYGPGMQFSQGKFGWLLVRCNGKEVSVGC